MEYNDVSKEKVISARYDNNLNELFVLRGGRRHDDTTPLDSKTLLQYYMEIRDAVNSVEVEDDVITPGKLLKA